MDINSWKKVQKVYIKPLTVLPSEEGKHFYFVSVFLYYFRFLPGVHISCVLKREIMKRNRKITNKAIQYL